MRVIGGLLIVALGIALVAFSANLAKTFGRREWAERYIGGTMQGFIAVGFAVMVLGVLMMFGNSFVKPDPMSLKINK